MATKRDDSGAGQDRSGWVGYVQIIVILAAIAVALYFAQAPDRVRRDVASDLGAERGKPVVDVIRPESTAQGAGCLPDGFGPHAGARHRDVGGRGPRGVALAELQEWRGRGRERADRPDRSGRVRNPGRRGEGPRRDSAGAPANHQKQCGATCDPRRERRSERRRARVVSPRDADRDGRRRARGGAGGAESRKARPRAH